MDTKKKPRIACSTSVRCGYSLEEAVEAMGIAGFREIDLLAIDGWAHVNTSDMVQSFEATVERVDRLLCAKNLTPIAMNTGVGPQLHDRSDEANARRLEETKALLKFMQHYGVKVAALQPRNQDAERPWQEVIDDCVKTLREQIALAEEAGISFAVELHVRSPFETLEQARYLLERMPEVPLVYDPTHFVMQGMEIRETTWIMENAHHAHVRDAAEGKLQAPYGEGAVDFDWLLGTLRDRGYAGLLSIEYLGGKNAEFDVIESAKRLYDKIAEYFPPN